MNRESDLNKNPPVKMFHFVFRIECSPFLGFNDKFTTILPSNFCQFWNKSINLKTERKIDSQIDPDFF